MCLAVPVKIVEVKGEMALVELDGIRREANLCFVPEAGTGDYVLLHAGFAIQKWGKKDVAEFHEIMSGMRRGTEESECP